MSASGLNCEWGFILEALHRTAGVLVKTAELPGVSWTAS